MRTYGSAPGPGSSARRFGRAIHTLPTEVVLVIHEHLVREFAETGDPVSPAGVKDQGLLESAVSRQHVGSGTELKYPTPCANAASLIFGLCNNHPFHNGNKRTALLAGLLHLDRNGFVLDQVTKDELFEMMRRIASYSVTKVSQKQLRHGVRPSADEEIAGIEKWLRSHARPIVKGERNITFGQLYKILEKFGYRLGEKNHNKVEILQFKKGLFQKHAWRCVYKTGCPGDSRQLSIDQIKEVREALSLREEDGVDSSSFYDTQTIIDLFIAKHRAALRQLAKF